MNPDTERKSLYESLPVAVFAVDGELRVIWCNQAARNAYPPLEAPDGLEKLLREPLYTVLDRLTARREVCAFRTGSLYGEATFYVIPEYDGEVFRGALVQCVDEAARENPALRRDQLRQMQDYIVQSAAASIGMLKGLFRAGVPSETGGTLGRLYVQNMRLLRFARSCAAYEEYTCGGDPESGFGNLDLSALIRELGREIAGVLLGKVGFEYLLPEEPVLLRGDARRLSEAVAAVVRDAADGAGRVTLEISASPQQVLLTVQSDAFILPEEVRRRNQPAGLTVCDGDGLGLLTAGMIFEAHGGGLRVEKTPDGRRYTVTLQAGTDPEIPFESPEPYCESGFSAVRLEFCDYLDEPFIPDAQE